MTRPLIGTYDTSDVAIQERRKQQQRFRDAQLIQREMSQLERQYEELEEVGRHIEQCLRDADNSEEEGGDRRGRGGCGICIRQCLKDELGGGREEEGRREDGLDTCK